MQDFKQILKGKKIASDELDNKTEQEIKPEKEIKTENEIEFEKETKTENEIKPEELYNNCVQRRSNSMFY